MMNEQPQFLLTTAVNQLLHKSDLPATLTIEQSASLLAMSMTSFRRKLAQEETTFKIIQSKFLNELCVDALLTHHMNIEGLAIKLGYSERATFERTFRKKFGVTPSQFRKLSYIGDKDSSHQKLTEIAENMPPMPSSCNTLIAEKDKGLLDIQRVNDIISKDVIFSARLMGLASKAIYGKTPKNLTEAIGRNLGINNVINFALIFAVKDALQEHVNGNILEQYTQAFLVAPKLFQMVRKSLRASIKFDIALTEQVIVFALMGVFLLSHNKAYKHELMRYSLKGIADLNVINRYTRQVMEISIFSSSSLMLSLWHIDASLIKQLNHLEKITNAGKKGSDQDELLLFMLSCLFHFAGGHQDWTELTEKANLLQIKEFNEIKSTVFS